MLSQVLAIGFLLVILSSALYQNYLPLLVVATYILAPVPNWICGKASRSDDFMDSGSNSVVELGRFMTGFLVVMGVGASGCSLLSLWPRHILRAPADLPLTQSLTHSVTRRPRALRNDTP